MLLAGKSSSGRTQRRGRDILLLIVTLFCIALFAQRNFRDPEEEQKMLEAEQKIEQVLETSKKRALVVLQTAPLAFAEAIREPFPTAERQYRIDLKLLNIQLAQEPNNPSIIYSRSELFYEQGDYEAALIDVERALALEPTSLMYLESRAFLHSKLKNYEQAIKDYDQLLLKAPERAADWLNSRAYYLAKLGDFEGALRDIERSLELVPDEPHSLDTLAYIYVGQSRYKEAVEVYGKALESEPDNEYALRGRAVAYHQLGQSERSQADLAKQIEINPDFCLHWELDPDPGDHEDVKSVLSSDAE